MLRTRIIRMSNICSPSKNTCISPFSRLRVLLPSPLITCVVDAVTLEKTGASHVSVISKIYSLPIIPGWEGEVAKLSDEVFDHGRVVAMAGSTHNVWQSHLKNISIFELTKGWRSQTSTFALRPLVEVVACWLLTLVMELAVLKLVVELADTLWELTVLKLVFELTETDDSEVDDCNIGNWVNSNCWPNIGKLKWEQL